jgi:dihydropteroate synthase
VERGVTLINDVYGFRDPELIEVAAQAATYVCIGHMQGEPATMQLSPHYPDGVMNTLRAFFEERVDILIKRGVKENRIYLDPGIGFGKTVADNLTIIQNLGLLKRLGFPLLLGVSRKNFLAKLVGKPATELLAATLAVNAKLMLEGVEMLRVHDVAEHNDMRKVLFPH